MRKTFCRSISNGIFTFLLVVAALYAFVPVGCVLDEGGMASFFALEHFAKVLVAVLLLFLWALPIVSLVIYALYHHSKRVVITPKTIVMHTPLKKVEIVARNDLLAFGTVHIGFRNTQIYICFASQETVLKYYEEHFLECGEFLKQCGNCGSQVDGDDLWNKSLALYVYHRQPKTFFLAYGNEKRLLTIKQALCKDAHNLDFIKV